jgi:hypothetical protein
VIARIHHLITSPGHNYFGRHGMPGGAHPVTEHEELELVAGKGIPGDRFFSWKDDYKGQLTLIDLAVIDDVRRHAGKPGLPATAFRRNVVISGVDLNELVGKIFRLGGIILEGTEECRPCYWMDQACGKDGTEALMRGRGGLRCRILSDGRLKLGPVSIEPEGLRSAEPETHQNR